MADRDALKRAVAAAIAGDWDGAHKIVQGDELDPLYCWLHACLHKIEGDNANAHYWYARTDRRFEDYADSSAELGAIADALK